MFPLPKLSRNPESHIDLGHRLLSEPIMVAKGMGYNNIQGPSPEQRAQWGNQPSSQGTILWEQGWRGYALLQRNREDHQRHCILRKTYLGPSDISPMHTSFGKEAFTGSYYWTMEKGELHEDLGDNCHQWSVVAKSPPFTCSLGFFFFLTISFSSSKFKDPREQLVLSKLE